MKKLLLGLGLLMMITASLFGLGPPLVDLGTAGNYVIMAKTGVSTTGTTAIVGDIGVSPEAATAITGFGLTLDSSGTFSTSPLVDGRIYAADYTDPTPTILITAIGDMETAYTDAAGRPDPDYTELYEGDLTGQTFYPGLYNWSTGVLISAGGMTISGGANDVWIFQIAQNLTVADGAIITLSDGANPENIFWQVAGQTNIGTTVQFKGVVLCQTLISLDTGASVVGRLLAQTAVTLDANAIETGQELLAPVATIAIVEGSAEISWDMDFDVTGYKVYAADEPFSNLWDLTSTIDDNMVTQYSEAVVNRKFYRVTSYLNELESDFSETVGYVGYELEQGLNFVAIPMVDESLSWAQDLADAIGPVDVVNKWNPAGQTWTSAYEFGGIWNDDEEGIIAGTGVYLININQPVANFVFFSVGTIFEPLAQHNLVAGLNSIMIPVDRHDINHAGETTIDGLGLGDEIGPVDVVNKWSSSAQTWTAAYKYGGAWNDDFEISIGDPLLINLTEAVNWPELRSPAFTRFQSRN